MADRITPEEVARLAHYLDPDAGDDRKTPAEALRAVGYYLDPERPVAVDPDPTTIDVSGTGLPRIVVGDDGHWWWGETTAAAVFWSDGWSAYTHGMCRRIASGPETGPEARRLAFEALERYVDSKRGR